MYVFGWIVVAAAVMMAVYYLARQSKDPGVEVFPLNYVKEPTEAKVIQMRPLEEQPKVEE